MSPVRISSPYPAAEAQGRWYLTDSWTLPPVRTIPVDAAHAPLRIVTRRPDTLSVYRLLRALARTRSAVVRHRHRDFDPPLAHTVIAWPS